MRYALGSNRAEYGQKKALTTQIRMGFILQGLTLEDACKVKLPRRISELREYWNDLYIHLKAEGKIK
jgi:hypothetical protein